MRSKAIFLLVIFLLNTVVGFGCALGMEGDHHDGNHSHVHRHEYKTTPISGQNLSHEDLCCKTLVNDLVTQSKLIPESGKVQVVLPAIWLPDFIHALLVPVAPIKLDQRFYVEQRSRPPNHDIRIVIQSFQI